MTMTPSVLVGKPSDDRIVAAWHGLDIEAEADWLLQTHQCERIAEFLHATCHELSLLELAPAAEERLVVWLAVHRPEQLKKVIVHSLERHVEWQQDQWDYFAEEVNDFLQKRTAKVLRFDCDASRGQPVPCPSTRTPVSQPWQPPDPADNAHKDLFAHLREYCAFSLNLRFDDFEYVFYRPVPDQDFGGFLLWLQAHDAHWLHFTPHTEEGDDGRAL